MHAEEVDLGHVHGLVVHARVHGDSRDHAHERARLAGAHAHVPVLHEPRRGQSPLQERDRVVESAGGGAEWFMRNGWVLSTDSAGRAILYQHTQPA